MCAGSAGGQGCSIGVVGLWVRGGLNSDRFGSWRKSFRVFLDVSF